METCGAKGDLSDTVMNTFSKGQPIDSKGQLIDSNGRPIDPITKVSYLRGLDGRLPGQKNPPQAASSQSSSLQQSEADQFAAPQQTAATPETASHFESAEPGPSTISVYLFEPAFRIIARRGPNRRRSRPRH